MVSVPRDVVPECFECVYALAYPIRSVTSDCDRVVGLAGDKAKDRLVLRLPSLGMSSPNGDASRSVLPRRKKAEQTPTKPINSISIFLNLGKPDLVSAQRPALIRD